MTPDPRDAMADYEVTDCTFIIVAPDADGDSPFFKVGMPTYIANKPKSEWPIVQRITLQRDVHGEYCMRVRACVWVDGKLFFECPYQGLTGVGYAL